MSFELSGKVLQYIEDREAELIALIEELCRIPAPSHHEEKRAEFCKNWLEACGAQGVTIDSALNVIYPIGCEGRDDIVVFLAHTDTVFPDTSPMPVLRDEEYIYSPGVGDDTARVALMLMIAKYVAQEKLTPSCGVMFVANSCEEGLGNLKGIRRIMSDYEGRIKEVYSFDANYDVMFNKCVGSHRYEITLTTEGGHSYYEFGNRNAIHAAADLVCKLYDCKVSVDNDSKTTYNVGHIEGGTSVNTIAQKATVYYEYRSDDMSCLDKMKAFFEQTIDNAKKEGKADISINVLGIRPCGGAVDQKRLDEMSAKVIEVCQKHTGMPCTPHSASTDCNIPMSLGIPAVCVGNCMSYGAHTREEKLLLSSLRPGLKITAEIILEYFC